MGLRQVISSTARRPLRVPETPQQTRQPVTDAGCRKGALHALSKVFGSHLNIGDTFCNAIGLSACLYLQFWSVLQALLNSRRNKRLPNQQGAPLYPAVSAAKALDPPVVTFC